MSALKAIHVARRQLGLDDDDYRAMLERVTGKSSSTLLTSVESGKVLDEMRRLGFKPLPRKADNSNVALSGPYAGKLIALWLSAWNLGVARSNTDAALIAFVERQTGIEHLNWVREQRDAMRAIEGLKKWIARESGVVWPVRATPRQTKLAVIEAQCRILGDPDKYAEAQTHFSLQVLDNMIASLGTAVREKADG